MVWLITYTGSQSEVSTSIQMTPHQHKSVGACKNLFSPKPKVPEQLSKLAANTWKSLQLKVHKYAHIHNYTSQ